VPLEEGAMRVVVAAIHDPLWVYQPGTWLLREGWRKAGVISVGEVPSERQ